MNNFGLHQLWPTIVLETKLEDNIQTEISNIIEDVEFSPAPADWGSTHKISKPRPLNDENITNSQFGDDVISQYGLTALSQEIHKYVLSYCQVHGLRYTKYKRSSWFTLFEKGDYAILHNHGTSAISGCYYYKTSGEDSNIFFRNPLPQMVSSSTYNVHSGINIIKVEIGKMLLFPGWLDHGVIKNETDEKRISLAFNIYFPDEGFGVEVDAE